MCYSYLWKSISELQIQTATYVFELSRVTVTARWQHYLVLLWRATIGMRMTIKTEQLLQDGGAPEYCTTIEQRGVVRFLWAKNTAAKDIHK